MRKHVLPLLLSAVMLTGLSGCGEEKLPTPTDIYTPTDDTAVIERIRESGQLVVGCKTDVPELSFYDSLENEWSGLETELAYETASEIFGVSVEEAKEQNLAKLVGVSVADREQKLESGEIDLMLATYTITDERELRFDFSKPYFTSYIAMMVNYSGSDADSLGTNDIRSIADLDGKYVGVPDNATTRRDFIDYINMFGETDISPVFCEFESYEQLYAALKNGNIDVMAVDESILNGYCDDSTLILPDRFAGQNYGGAVRKENRAILTYLDSAIEKHK